MMVRYLAVVLLACLASLGAQAQQSLSELVTEARADWMFGSWEAQTDNGDTVRLNVTWDLDKHVVVLHVKTTDMESKGYTALDAASREAKYVSFDNRGSVGKGTWGMESSELVLRTESQNPERGPWKVAFVFTGSATEGLQVRMHPLNESGGLVSPARMTLKFKKQK
jgi:hypothetical protein